MLERLSRNPGRMGFDWAAYGLTGPGGRAVQVNRIVDSLSWVSNEAESGNRNYANL